MPTPPAVPTARATAESPPPGYHGRKDDRIPRLHKVEGQVRGLARMVEADRYRTEVVVQITAVARPLREVALSLLDNHVRHCVHDAAARDQAEADGRFDELNTALRSVLRL